MSLSQVLRHPALWKASEHTKVRMAVSTGYQRLDHHLHDGGWPKGALTEILLPHHGVGELRLLTPLLKAYSQESGFILFINPPLIPYVDALSNQGIACHQLLLLHTNSTQDAIWAAQQALTSGSCSVVMIWSDDPLAVLSLRKLSLAATQGSNWAFLLRPQSYISSPSMASLRSTLTPLKNGCSQIHILKQPGGWSDQRFSLKLLTEQQYWTSAPGRQWPVPECSKRQTMMAAYKQYEASISESDHLLQTELSTH